VNKRAAIYLRISEDRDGLRLGVDRQREDCFALAERLGWEIEEVFEDNNVSAYSGKVRPAYQSMLEAIRDRRVDAVIAWHTDRLHRSTREQLDYIDLSNQYNLTTQTVSAGPLDLSTPAGRATAVTLGAWAKYESEQKGERQRRAGLQSAKAGKPTGGPRPFGFKAGSLELEPTEAKMIREACTDLLGGVSLGSITRQFNESGVPTSRGGKWTGTQVKSVLGRARNAGLRSYQGEVIGEAQWPAIVPEETWRAVSAILNDPSRRTSPGYGRRYLLSGLAICGACGLTVTSAGTQRIRADGSRRICYRCRSRKHVARDVEPVDEYVSAVVVGRLQREDARDLLAVDQSVELARLRDEGNEARASLDETAVMFAEGSITSSQLRTINTRLMADLARVEARQAELASADVLAELIEAGDVTQAWDRLDLGKRRAVVDALMVVTINPERTRGARMFNPELVAIEWKSHD
jgi:site-specific DNA recombinase